MGKRTDILELHDLIGIPEIKTRFAASVTPAFVNTSALAHVDALNFSWRAFEAGAVRLAGAV